MLEEWVISNLKTHGYYDIATNITSFPQLESVILNIIRLSSFAQATSFWEAIDYLSSLSPPDFFFGENPNEPGTWGWYSA